MINREIILKRIETELFVPQFIAVAYLTCSRDTFEVVYGLYIRPIKTGHNKKKLYSNAELKSLPQIVLKKDHPKQKASKPSKLCSMNIEEIFANAYRAARIPEDKIQRVISTMRNRALARNNQNKKKEYYTDRLINS